MSFLHKSSSSATVIKIKPCCYELDQDFDRESFYGQFGQGSTFPQVVVDATNLGGCSETIQYLKEKKLV